MDNLILSEDKKSVKFVVSDLHFPFFDDKVLSRFEEHLEKDQPDKLIMAGDMIDCGEISKFSKNPHTTISLKEEIQGFTDLIKEWLRISPKITIVYIFGNHEFRLSQFLMRQAPELYDFIQLEDLFNFGTLPIEIITGRKDVNKFVDNYIQEDGFTIGHFDKALQEPGASVNWLYQKRIRGSIIQSHCHKAAHVIKKDIEGNIYHLMECGCLCKTQSSFTSETNWINAFVKLRGGAPELVIL